MERNSALPGIRLSPRTSSATSFNAAFFSLSLSSFSFSFAIPQASRSVSRAFRFDEGFATSIISPFPADNRVIVSRFFFFFFLLKAPYWMGEEGRRRRSRHTPRGRVRRVLSAWLTHWMLITGTGREHRAAYEIKARSFLRL